MGIPRAAGRLAPAGVLVMLVLTLVHILFMLIERRRINLLITPEGAGQDQGTRPVVTLTQPDGLSDTDDGRALPWTRDDSLAPTMIGAPEELSSFVPLITKNIASIQRFVFFVGYPRSGHSIVASLMDAHPDMVIAHEFDLFNKLAKHKDQLTRKWLYDSLCENSYTSAMKGWRSREKTKKGYTLDVSHSWQGSFRDLRVIGDKAAGMSAMAYKTSRADFLKVYQRILQAVQVPVSLIHVVRNPYDMIATRTLYGASNTSMKLSNVTREHRYNNTELLGYYARRVIRTAGVVQSIINDTGTTSSVLEIHLVDLVRNPRATMLYVCAFLGVECSWDYLQACEYKTFQQVPKSRGLVEWTEEVVENVRREMKQFSFFQRYSFDSG